MPNTQLKLDQIVYAVCVSIVPVSVVSPKATVPLLLLLSFFLLLWNSAKVSTVLIRGGVYSCIFLPLLFVGFLSGTWSLDPNVSWTLAVKLLALVYVGCLVFAGLSSLTPDKNEFLKHALMIGVFLGCTLVFFEIATNSWLYRTTRGYGWDQVLFEETGGINIDSPVKSSLTTLSVYIWLILANRKVQIFYSIPAFLVIFYAAWSFGANASLVAMTVGVFCVVLARFARRILAATLIFGFLVGVLASPFLAKFSLETITPSNVSEKLGSVPMPMSGMNRLITWKFTSGKILEKPLTGWGLRTSRIIPGGGDKYNIVRRLPDGTEHILSRDFFVPLHPHNLGLQIWLELGLQGALAAALAGTLLLLRAGRQMMLGHRSIWLVGVIVTILSHSFFSFGVWQNWWIALQFLVVALLLIVLKGNEHRPLRD